MSNEIRKIADHFGLPSQLNKKVEESLEAAEATAQFHCALMFEDDPEELARKREAMIEEMADEAIMTSQILYFLGAEGEFERMRQKKIERTLKRMKDGYYAKTL